MLLKNLLKLNFSKFSLMVLVLMLGLLSTVPRGQASSPQIQAPQLLDVEITREKQVYVQGLTAPNTKILVYINDSFKNYANIKEKTENKVNSFSYLSGFQLQPGRHNITVIAQDKNSSLLSPPSSHEVSIYGQTPEQASSYPVPSPVLITPQSKNLSNTRPKIIGLAANHTKIAIYLDGNFLGETGFVFHPSGTAGFNFTPSQDIKPGKHKIWAVAIDSSGRKSARSNYIDLYLRSVQGDKTSSPQPPTSEQEPKETEKTELKPPQILSPQNGASIKPENLIIKTKINQIVDKIDIYIDGTLEKSLTPNVESGHISEINYKPEELSRGSHTLYLTSQKNGQTSSPSTQINFNILDPQINDAVREEKPTTSPETPKTGSTSASSSLEDPSQEPQNTATTSQNWFNQDIKRYIIFGGIVIVVLLIAAWSNRDVIKKMLKK